MVHEDKVVIRRGVREPPNSFATADVFCLIFAGGVDIRQLHYDAAVADVHIALLGQGAGQIWTARTLASARARGALPEGMLAHLGGRQVHVPDLVATLSDGRQVAFEVEMSRKSPRRLADINECDLMRVRGAGAWVELPVHRNWIVIDNY